MSTKVTNITIGTKEKMHRCTKTMILIWKKNKIDYQKGIHQKCIMNAVNTTRDGTCDKINYSRKTEDKYFPETKRKRTK